MDKTFCKAGDMILNAICMVIVVVVMILVQVWWAAVIAIGVIFSIGIFCIPFLVLIGIYFALLAILT